jgi:TatD DNase family protein
MFIDVHAHLDMLEESPAEVLARAQAAGVSKIVTIGTEPKDHEFVLQTAKQFYPHIYCTLGVHPHQGMLWQEEVGQWIEAHVGEKEVIAVGEIGLDYYYNQSPVDEQRLAFQKQLEIAERTKMPVQIHTREADQDTFEILKPFTGKVKGLIHCFTSSQWLAEKCIEMGFNISFSGIVTFKNAESLRETCRWVPLNRIHVETDSPFLSPVPKRGQKNTPAHVVHTAELVAQIKGVSLEELARITNENARQLFPKIQW